MTSPSVVEVLVPTAPRIVEVVLRGRQGPPGIADTADTIAAAEATSFGISKQFVRVAGYSSAGDGGAALYKKVGSEPSHAGKFQSDDGAWWEIADWVIYPEMLGAKADGATDDWPAIQGALSIGREVRLLATDDSRTYIISAPLVMVNPGQTFGGLGNMAFIKATSTFPVSGTAVQRSMIVLNDEHQRLENLDLHCGEAFATDIHGRALHAIYLDSARQATLRRIETHASTGSGIVLHAESWGATMETVTVSYSNNWGVELDGNFHTIEDFRTVHVIDPTTGGFSFNSVEGFVMSACAMSCNTAHAVNGSQVNNRVFFKGTGGVKGVIIGADVENSPRLFDLTNSDVTVSGGRFLRFGDDASPPTDGVVKLANSRISFNGGNAFEFADDFGPDGFWEIADEACSVVWRANQQEARRFGVLPSKNLNADLHRGKWSCPDNVSDLTGDATVYTFPFETLIEYSGKSGDEIKTSDMSAGVLTVPYSGFYRFTLEFWRTVPTGHTHELIYYSINGGTNTLMYRRPCNTQFGEQIDNISRELLLTAGDTIAFKWRVDGGSKDADLSRCWLIHMRLQ